ncbi:hypothetical protein [Mesorhizobium sp. B2-3-11]|uniref:hypothetical protein n=1 Tax=Mesorhizobium sp. B2-3-11 TaxID=2589953 RepID=UPI0015E47CE8|nr:hypothetical protein [Mesorhizobium sp. B2-3-11]
MSSEITNLNCLVQDSNSELAGFNACSSIHKLCLNCFAAVCEKAGGTGRGAGQLPSRGATAVGHNVPGRKLMLERLL